MSARDRPRADEEPAAQRDAERRRRTRVDRADPLPRALDAPPHRRVEDAAARDLEAGEARRRRGSPRCGAPRRSGRARRAAPARAAGSWCRRAGARRGTLPRADRWSDSGHLTLAAAAASVTATAVASPLQSVPTADGRESPRRSAGPCCPVQRCPSTPPSADAYDSCVSGPPGSGQTTLASPARSGDPPARRSAADDIKAGWCTRDDPGRAAARRPLTERRHRLLDVCATSSAAASASWPKPPSDARRFGLEPLAEIAELASSTAASMHAVAWDHARRTGSPGRPAVDAHAGASRRGRRSAVVPSARCDAPRSSSSADGMPRPPAIVRFVNRR